MPIRHWSFFNISIRGVINIYLIFLFFYSLNNFYLSRAPPFLILVIKQERRELDEFYKIQRRKDMERMERP